MHKHDGERGQTLPIVAIAVVLLVGFAALAVDAGYLEYKQRTQQTAADAAAISGAWALLSGGSVTPAAQASATTNGFTDDGTTVVVSATSPPGDGPNNGNTSAVEVNVTVQYPAVFSAVWGRKQNAVSTRAVAVVENDPNGPCIWAISGDFTDNNGTISAPCGILASKDVQINGATVTVPSIGAGGHVSSSPSGTVVSQGIPAFSDPCQTIPGCRALTAMFPYGSAPGPGPFSSCVAASGTSLTANCYTSLSGTFDLAPGLYVVQGDLSASFTCNTCTANSGVTLVVGGKVNLNGATSVLTAPPNYQGTGTPTISGSSGAPGVLIYQTTKSTSPENFSAQSLLGMIYAPGAHLNLDGGSSTLSVTYVVASDIVANKSVITVPAGGSGNPSQVPVLAE